MKKTLSITILIALATITVSGQAAKDKKASPSLYVEEVDIRGNRRISEADIRSWISTHKDGKYSPKRLDRDVHILFSTGHFTEVKVYVEEGLYGEKIVTFEVAERPLILDVDFEGIGPSQQIEAAEEWQRRGIELSKGTEYDPESVKRVANIIQEMLNKQNENMLVVPYVEERTATELVITFKIEKPDKDR